MLSEVKKSRQGQNITVTKSMIKLVSHLEDDLYYFI